MRKDRDIVRIHSSSLVILMLAIPVSKGEKGGWGGVERSGGEEEEEESDEVRN